MSQCRSQDRHGLPAHLPHGLRVRQGLTAEDELVPLAFVTLPACFQDRTDPHEHKRCCHIIRLGIVHPLSQLGQGGHDRVRMVVHRAQPFGRHADGLVIVIHPLVHLRLDPPEQLQGPGHTLGGHTCNDERGADLVGGQGLDPLFPLQSSFQAFMRAFRGLSLRWWWWGHHHCL